MNIKTPQILYPIFDYFLLITSALLALRTRVGDISLWDTDVLFVFAAALGLLTILALHKIDHYKHSLKDIEHRVIYQSLKASLLYSLLLYIALKAFGTRIPRSFPFICFSYCCIFTINLRVIPYLYYSRKRNKTRAAVGIFGFGNTGRQLADSLKNSPDFKVVAFFDHNSTKLNRVYNGIKVYAPEQTTDIIKQKQIKRVLLAVPSASSEQRKSIINSLLTADVSVLTVPSSSQVINNHKSAQQLRKVDPVDLLGRDPVDPNWQQITHHIKDKTILVTGAGGSIGSELSIRIAEHQPAKLILLDSCELNLFNINQLLTNLHASLTIEPILADASNKQALIPLFENNDIKLLYHAAAYKHVPLVEANPLTGLINNIISTQTLAELATEYSLEQMLLVSTDKAVRPTNIMGASKRVCELLMQEYDAKSNTKFTSVRFGNVLASSGSVIPTFSKQISKGGPVTVTSEQITRYFMTIPEAVTLIVAASEMAQGGEIFVLDMGESVLISTLAKKMIRLAGYSVKDQQNPHGDIEIQYTGLRPGEKMYEELSISGNLSATDHPRINVCQESKLQKSRAILIEQLTSDLEYGNKASIIHRLYDPLISYSPSK